MIQDEISSRNEDQPYTVQEVATLLRTRRYTVYKMLKEGRIGGFRVSNRWRIPVEELKKFMAIPPTKAAKRRSYGKRR